jgi:hypothetical protein
VWDRIREGAGNLFGVPGESVMGQGARDYAANQGLLAFGGSLLQQSAPQREPWTVASSVGNALGAGREGAQAGMGTAMAIEQQQAEVEREMLRQSVLAKYAGSMSDPQALRQAANELAQAGDMDGAKLMADIAKATTESAGSLPTVTGVPQGAAPGTRPSIFERLPGGDLRNIGLSVPPITSELVSIVSSYERQVGPYRDSTRFLNDMLDSAGQAERGDAAAEVALAAGLVDATTPAAARFRADLSRLDPANTLLDKITTGYQKIVSGGPMVSGAIIPASQIPNVRRIMEQMLKRNLQYSQEAYEQYGGMMQRYGGALPDLGPAPNEWLSPSRRGRVQGAGSGVGSFDPLRGGR